MYKTLYTPCISSGVLDGLLIDIFAFDKEQ